MTEAEAHLLFILILVLSGGAITAKVASDRSVPGHPLLWFIGGALLFILALPLAIFSKPDARKAETKALKSSDSKKCPRCAELVKREALICRFCQYEFGPNDDWRVAIVVLAVLVGGAPLLAASVLEDRPVLSRTLKFRDDGKFSEDEPLVGHRFTKEEGVYNGVAYRFYHGDGSGTFGRYEESNSEKIFRESMARAGYKQPVKKALIGWKTNCKQDPMDDRRHCSANKDDLFVFWFDSNQLLISIGAKNAPGSQIAVRFGKESPLVASEKGWYGEAARKPLQRLIAESKVVTRYRKWPDNIDVDKETQLFGLKEVFDFLKFGVAQRVN